MKQTVEASLVRRRRALPIGAAAALMFACAAPAAQAAVPVVGVQINAGPKKVHGRIVTSMMSWKTTFSTDTPGAQLFTVQQAEIFFPDRTYGRFFPSCSAAQIERFNGDTSLCPKGSRVGIGRLTALVVPAGVPAAGRVRVFNSNHGRSLTFNIQTTVPARINQSFDAPLTNLTGKYPMKLVMTVPPSLQEVLPGLFVGLQTFNLSISGVITTHGKRHHFLPVVCPKYGLHAAFTFLDTITRQPTTAETDADLNCTDFSKSR